MSKYDFTDEVKYIEGRKLKRIRAIRDFGNVSKGDLGGFLSSYTNLSHDGDCWVGEHGCVFGSAEVRDNAYVHGGAIVRDDAVIKDNAEVFDNAYVSGYSEIGGDSEIYGFALVTGCAEIYGNAEIHGSARVSGSARISDYAMINFRHSVMCVTNIGSRADTTTFYKGCDGNIYVTCGCFFGNIEMFEREVERTHNGNNHAKAYKIAIELAKVNIK